MIFSGLSFSFFVFVSDGVVQLWLLGPRVSFVYIANLFGTADSHLKIDLMLWTGRYVGVRTLRCEIGSKSHSEGDVVMLKQGPQYCQLHLHFIFIFLLVQNSFFFVGTCSIYEGKNIACVWSLFQDWSYFLLFIFFIINTVYYFEMCLSWFGVIEFIRYCILTLHEWAVTSIRIV